MAAFKPTVVGRGKTPSRYLPFRAPHAKCLIRIGQSERQYLSSSRSAVAEAAVNNASLPVSIGVDSRRAAGARKRTGD